MRLKTADLIFDSRDCSFGIIYSVERDQIRGNCYKVFWTCDINTEETDRSIKADQYIVYETD